MVNGILRGNFDDCVRKELNLMEVVLETDRALDFDSALEIRYGKSF